MTIEIRKATAADIDTIVSIYQEASQWLASKGLDQWQPQHGEEVSKRIRQAVAKSIERGTCFVADTNRETIATITIDTYADPEFWFSDDQPNQALYIHRMVVRRSHAGRGIGKLLLDWANNFASKRGYRWVRLDAWRTNDALHHYYQQLGFEHVRTLTYPHRGSGALFQKPTI